MVAVFNNYSTITRLIAYYCESGPVADRKRTERPAMFTNDKLAKGTN